MGSARARPGPILPGLKIRAPTETGSPSGPKREWPLGHRRKTAAARCRRPLGHRVRACPEPSGGVAARPSLGVGDLSDRGYTGIESGNICKEAPARNLAVLSWSWERVAEAEM